MRAKEGRSRLKVVQCQVQILAQTSKAAGIQLQGPGCLLCPCGVKPEASDFPGSRDLAHRTWMEELQIRP